MALHSRDVQKLLNAGFTIIRADNENLKIKHKCTGYPDWTIFQNGFKSKVELRRRMDDILKNCNDVIED